MLIAFVRGSSKTELAARYGLKENSIGAILRAEHHMLAVSPYTPYREFRNYFAGRKGKPNSKSVAPWQIHNSHRSLADHLIVIGSVTAEMKPFNQTERSPNHFEATTAKMRAEFTGGA